MDTDPADAQGAGARLSGWSGRRGDTDRRRSWSCPTQKNGRPVEADLPLLRRWGCQRSGIEPTRFLIRAHGVSLPSGSTRQRWGPSRRQQLAGPFRKTPMGSRVTRARQGEIARIIEGNTRGVVGGLPPERAVFRCVGHSFRECSFMGRDPTRRCADRPDAVDASSGLLPWIPMISRVAVSRRRDP